MEQGAGVSSLQTTVPNFGSKRITSRLTGSSVVTACLKLRIAHSLFCVYTVMVFFSASDLIHFKLTLVVRSSISLWTETTVSFPLLLWNTLLLLLWPLHLQNPSHIHIVEWMIDYPCGRVWLLKPLSFITVNASVVSASFTAEWLEYSCVL